MVKIPTTIKTQIKNNKVLSMAFFFPLLTIVLMPRVGKANPPSMTAISFAIGINNKGGTNTSA